MKKSTLVWLAVALVVVAGGVVPRVLGHGKPGAKAGSGARQGRAAAVDVKVMRQEALADTVIAAGTLVPGGDVELRAEASGRVVAMHLREGSWVRKGDLLVKLNDAELTAQLRKAQAAAQLARQKEKRQQELFSRSMVSAEDVEVAARDREAAEADAQLVQAQLAKTEIRAPFDGQVGLTAVTVGSYLSPGATVVRIVATRPLMVEFSVPQRHAPMVGQGTQVTFTVLGSTRRYQAAVVAREPRIDPQTRTVAVKARCVDPDSATVPGAFAEVTVATGGRSGFILPGQALIPDIEGYRVFVADSGKARPRPVTTGSRDDHNVEIVSGLRVGDTVVVTGVFMLSPGTALDIRKVD